MVYFLGEDYIGRTVFIFLGILTYLGVFGATTWHCANRIRKRLPIKGLLWWFYTLLAVFLSSAFFVGCLFTLSARTAWLCMQLFMPPPNSAARDEMHISVLRASFVLNRLPVVFFTLLYTVLAMAWINATFSLLQLKGTLNQIIRITFDYEAIPMKLFWTMIALAGSSAAFSLGVMSYMIQKMPPKQLVWATQDGENVNTAPCNVQALSDPLVLTSGWINASIMLLLSASFLVCGIMVFLCIKNHPHWMQKNKVLVIPTILSICFSAKTLVLLLTSLGTFCYYVPFILFSYYIPELVPACIFLSTISGGRFFFWTGVYMNVPDPEDGTDGSEMRFLSEEAITYRSYTASSSPPPPMHQPVSNREDFYLTFDHDMADSTEDL